MTRHLELLNEALVRVAAGRILRLLVTFPPRHGKSEFISKYFPAWFVGRFPQKRIILSSYEADFAAGWGGKARDVLLDVGPDLFTIELDKQASNHWTITRHGGGMQTSGVGGAITGKGADCFIIDDPVKNDEQALSARQREKTWDWYRSTAYTRLEPGAAMILMMTRWHQDDLAGRILQNAIETGERWIVLNIPALCEAPESPIERVLGRKLDDPLWPARYPKDKLLEIKHTVGSFWWAALYQQRPAPLEGGLIKKRYFRYYTLEGEAGNRYVVLREGTTVRRIAFSACKRFTTVDLAASTEEWADYTVASTFAETPTKDLLWLDCLREKLEGPDQPKLIRSAYEKWNPGYVGVEKHGYQLTFIQALKRAGYPIKALTPDGDKIARAIPLSVLYENGQVYHPIAADWLDAAETELMLFPNAPHDDIVDTAAYAAKQLVAPVGDVSQVKVLGA